VSPIVRDALDEILDAEREHHASQLAHARIGIADRQMRKRLSALQSVLAVERSKAIDLPSVARSVN
jgi:hypothetical protein